MSEKPEIDVWDEARDLLLRWEVLTVELGKNVAGGATQNLLPLLGERRKLRDRLEALREDHGIKTWVEVPVKDRPSTAQEEIRAILSRLAVENERIRHELEQRMSSLKGKIAEVSRDRMANRHYQKRRRPIKGAFIDTRR